METIGPKVTAVIPTLGKNLERLNACIQSIKLHSSSHNLKIVVVDNSPDAQLSDFDGVDEVISPCLNLGWVGSLEFVRRNQNFDYLWTIQDDMTILNDVLGVLLNKFEIDSKLGVASPVLIRDGVIPARTRGGKFTDENNVRWINIPEVDIEPKFFSQNFDLCFVSGSGALWRKEALEQILGFDLNLYPLVHVDVDTCFRLKANNWKLSLSTEAHISHEIRGSTPNILGEILHYSNEEIIRNKFLSQNNPKVTLGLDSKSDFDFLLPIVKKSSYLFLEVSQKAQQTIYDLENQKSKIEKEFLNCLEVNKKYEIENQNLVNSKSWKMTKPLRQILKIAREILPSK